MNTNDQNSNIDDNFVDPTDYGFFDEAEKREQESKPNEREKARDLRADPSTGIRSASMRGREYGGADWLLGQPPEGQKPLLTERGPNRYTGKIEDVLYMPLGKVGLLAAPGGTGKTTILMQLAASVASGLPWLGRYDVAKPGRVLVVMGEEDEDNIDLLVWKAARGITGPMKSIEEQRAAAGKIAKNLHTWSVTGIGVGIEYRGIVKGRESFGAFHDSLRDYLAADEAAGGGDWSLIVIDPAARFFPSEAETDNAQATRFIESLEVLTDTKGRPAIIFAHHSAKSVRSNAEASANDARGSSAFVDGGRWMGVLQATKIPNADPVIKLSVEKSNYGPLSVEVLERTSWQEGGAFRVADAAAVERMKIEESRAKALQALGDKARADAAKKWAEEQFEQLGYIGGTQQTARDLVNMGGK